MHPAVVGSLSREGGMGIPGGMGMDMRRSLGRLALAFLALSTGCAWAQTDVARNYPSKAVRLVVGFAAGGGTDIVARLMGQKLSEAYGQPVVIENKPGTSGILGTEFVARAQPDGYTLLLSPSGVFVINPAMYSKLPYSPTRDFVPVSMVANFPLILVVNASQPIRSVKELVEQLKARPQSANYSASASAFQLATELFKIRTGTQMEYIPYKGTNESVNAVVSGDVLLTFADAGPATGAIKSGKARGLAVTAPARLAAFPDIPTMAEAGFTDMDIQLWMGIFAPAGTPPAIVAKLQDELARIVKLQEIRERLAGLSVNPVGSTSEELARTIANEIATWSAVAKASNVKPNN
jgi:tripartite-type tricarboxylate transporter receptor subunit TctC